MQRRIFASASVAAWARSYTALPNLQKPKGGPATLPALNFDKSEGIKPILSPRQIELHYDRHHKAYVDKLNTLAADGKFDGKTIEEIMKATVNDPASKVLFNQAAQHFNHTFYWAGLIPNGKAMPKNLEEAITKHFGSVDKFKQAFEAAAVGNFGSGWTWLVVDSEKKTLSIVNTGNAGCPTTENLRPIFTVDVWEHAYYKDFENKRADYLHEIWKIVNWEFVAEQYKKAIA